MKTDRKLTNKEMESMLMDGLLCGKCWGRTIRTMTTPKFMKRLIKFYTGQYSSGYSENAVENLRKSLDVCNKKIEQKAREERDKEVITFINNRIEKIKSHTYYPTFTLKTDIERLELLRDDLKEELKKKAK